MNTFVKCYRIMEGERKKDPACTTNDKSTIFQSETRPKCCLLQLEILPQRKMYKKNDTSNPDFHGNMLELLKLLILDIEMFYRINHS